jgi:hypothetical protein
MQDQSIKQALDALIDRGETRSIIDKSASAHRERINRVEQELMAEFLAISQALADELFLLGRYYYGTPDQVSSHSLHLARAVFAAAWREYLQAVQDVVSRAAGLPGNKAFLESLAKTAQTKMDVQFIVANGRLAIQAQEEAAQQAVKQIQADNGLNANPLSGLSLLDIEELVTHVTKTLPWQAVVNIESEPTAEGGVVTAQLSLT